MCGWEWAEGARSGKSDWNTLRHYCQKHGQTQHEATTFKVSSLVNKSWQAAHEAFKQGAQAVATEGDFGFNIPDFVLSVGTAS